MTKSTVLILIAVAACKSDKPAPTTGSGSAPLPPPIADAAPPKPSVDAAPPPAVFDQTIRLDGIGPINAETDPTKLADLFPGTKADVNHSEGEDHSSDTTTITQGPTHALDIVVDNMRDAKHVFRVDVYAGMFATSNGVRIGTTVAEFLAKDDSINCQRKTYDANPEGFDKALFCESGRLSNLAFYLDDKKYPGTDGKVLVAKIADAKIVRIIWKNPAVK